MPTEHIQKGLSYIEKLAYELGERQDREASEKDEKKGKKRPESFSVMWKRFFKYFKDEWMKKVKPEFFSLFDAPVRTNNLLERWHRYLNDQMGGKPGVQHFISKLSLIIIYLSTHLVFVRMTIISAFWYHYKKPLLKLPGKIRIILNFVILFNVKQREYWLAIFPKEGTYFH